MVCARPGGSFAILSVGIYVRPSVRPSEAGSRTTQPILNFWVVGKVIEKENVAFRIYIIFRKKIRSMDMIDFPIVKDQPEMCATSELFKSRS